MTYPLLKTKSASLNRISYEDVEGENQDAQDGEEEDVMNDQLPDGEGRAIVVSIFLVSCLPR